MKKCKLLINVYFYIWLLFLVVYFFGCIFSYLVAIVSDIYITVFAMLVIILSFNQSKANKLF